MQKLSIIILTVFFVISCKNSRKENSEISQKEEIVIQTFPRPTFTLAEADKLIELPLHCVGTEYPYKPGETLESENDLVEPIAVHPIFYGCFDWHSAVHGYWSMLTLLKQFPEMDKAEEVRKILKDKITSENVKIEVAYFEKQINKSFERTYGWAWLLKLSEELHNWDDPLAKELEQNLKPLADIIVLRYKEFLPKLNYPIRVGEHANTAFGLTFAYDYANSIGDSELKQLIEKRARDFYTNDENCPITWEPSGFDFLSPCLEEVDIMRRVLSSEEFSTWIAAFLPQLAYGNYHLKVGEVSDRTDGKLVHLDGLNFSRAWVFYGLAKQYPKYKHLKNLANEHVAYSYPNLVGDSYEGGHWLGSFAIYTLNTLHGK
ncbi:Protein of unknown function (DUF2891) [Aequorivita sublithincola DSM 14238]|uniref:DUF2891 domain-containing protein n=1 Tax=Aequorivita sublithincola (strain DSM 14238 / LMG 21431 / ACAM 643 / 9-3) TaxID=746697 RepID=I3YYF2_AEQSU|nr:DUF2891 domain-containing protein [Aequorivita sublithincola]AFL82020.1 Protein of unknown function (DUF2891) [Aequorivita sublithincola DSM 14238]